jgi:hypothetical protein
MFALNRLQQRSDLQPVALKCTKAGNEQPSKQPLEIAQKRLQIDQKHGGLEIRFQTATDHEVHDTTS